MKTCEWNLGDDDDADDDDNDGDDDYDARSFGTTISSSYYS